MLYKTFTFSADVICFVSIEWADKKCLIIETVWGGMYVLAFRFQEASVVASDCV